MNILVEIQIQPLVKFMEYILNLMVIMLPGMFIMLLELVISNIEDGKSNDSTNFNHFEILFHKNK